MVTNNEAASLKKKLHKVIDDIETMRLEMYHLASLHGMNHPSVLDMSMKIDEKINDYLRLKHW